MTKDQFEVLTNKLEEFTQSAKEQNLSEHEKNILRYKTTELVNYMCFWVEE